jgi:hypothetical protein
MGYSSPSPGAFSDFQLSHVSMEGGLCREHVDRKAMVVFTIKNRGFIIKYSWISMDCVKQGKIY